MRRRPLLLVDSHFSSSQHLQPDTLSPLPRGSDESCVVRRAGTLVRHYRLGYDSPRSTCGGWALVTG